MIIEFNDKLGQWIVQNIEEKEVLFVGSLTEATEYVMKDIRRKK